MRLAVRCQFISHFISHSYVHLRTFCPTALCNDKACRQSV